VFLGPVTMIKGNSTCLHVCSSLLEPKKMLISSINGVFYCFPPSTILQGNVRVFGRNVEKAKVEVRARVEDFL